jgi:hypothetical protein
MFDLGRLVRFLGKLLEVLIPFLLITLALAFLTELLTREGALAERLLNWRFWLSVGLDMIPAFVVMALSLWLAGRFVKVVYRLDSWKEGMGFLLRSRFGLPGFGPWMRVQKGEAEAEEKTILKHIGGRGHLVVYNDSAVVLENGGQLTRVEGAGFPELEPFEKIYDVVDLRPKRWVYTVSAMTREGIPINWDAEVHYQIDDGGQKPSPKTPFPLSKDQVFKAATCKWVFAVGGAEMMDWEGRVIISDTEGKLRSILARRRLDQLIGMTKMEDMDDEAAREAIQVELEEELRKTAGDVGAKILRVKLANLQVNDEVTQQWIKAWKAEWQRWSAGLLAQGEASHIYLYETVKAEAQMRLLVNIIQTLQRQAVSQVITPQIVLMRLFSVLDRAAFASSSRVFFPTQALDALDHIKALIPAIQVAAATVTLTANPASVPAGGQARLVAIVKDAQGNPISAGTPIQFSTTMGIVSPTQVCTTNGQVTSTFLAGSQTGLATITAQAGFASDAVTVEIC